MPDGMEVFRGGVAVITGGGSGIGRGLACLAAEQGMRVVVADIDLERARGVVAEIEGAGGEALAVCVDVGDANSMDALARATHDRFGDVRLLVNNAGIETLGFSWELDAAIWDKTLNINIHGAVHGVRAFAPRMLASGQPAWIANTASIGGLGIMPIQTSYIMSKHALIAFSECLYLEMQRDLMHGMLEADGISGEEAARRILPQIAAGDFWVSTHPDITREFAANRARHLETLGVPSLPQETLAAMGLSTAV